MTANIKRGGMKSDLVGRQEKFFGKGSGQEIEKVEANKKIVERIEELSKREEQNDKMEKMRLETKLKQREDRTFNFLRKKVLPDSVWRRRRNRRGPRNAGVLVKYQQQRSCGMMERGRVHSMGHPGSKRGHPEKMAMPMGSLH